MQKFLKERRGIPRIPAIFPATTSEGILGETVNINKKGICLSLEKDITDTQILSLKLNSPSTVSENLYLYLVWKRKASFKRFLCGGYFINFNKEDFLEKILSEYSSLKPEFIKLACDLRIFLSDFKKKCDAFDLTNESKEKEIEFINKSLLFSKLDEHFKEIWQIIKNFNEEESKLHQKYYQKILWPLLKEPVETNRIVCDKPLGYPGDFFIISYFYNFHNKYMGASSYAKLINFYTCNIPIALSVVERKNFLKKLILEILNIKKLPKILSIGSGPAKELTELLEEGKIKKEVYFDCLDFEKRALEFVRKEIDKIEKTKKEKIHLRFIYKNVLDLIKGKRGNLFKDYDLIYSAGVFDYFSSRVAKRIIQELYKLLKKEGKFLITNVKKEEVNHRAYYEILGNWVLQYRDRKDMLSWVKGLNSAEAKFEPISDRNSFLFLSIRRLK